ncbi:hypothetical protein M8C21_029663, partial [Ambrosia artemisiifolia]
GLIKMGDEKQEAEPVGIAKMLEDTYALVRRYSFVVRQPRVVGSGKSRLIEALIGRVFLPNTPTRRPLLVHLKRIRDGSDEEYAEFLHTPGTKLYDFNHIRTEIQVDLAAAAAKEKAKQKAKAKTLVREIAKAKAKAIRSQEDIMLNTTIKAAGKEKVIPLPPAPMGVVNRSQQAYKRVAERCGVPFLAKRMDLYSIAETDREAGGGFSDKELHLNIFSPNVLDITFVDLPGIPLGDGIEADRVRTIIMPYVNCPGSLILAVTPTTADIANSDAVQIAVTADPDCHRTLGVITKVDLLARGITDAAAWKAKERVIGKAKEKEKAKAIRSQEDIMMNTTIKAAGKEQVITLPSAPVGVVNRSQPDVSLNKTVKAAGEREVYPLRYGYVFVANRSPEDLILNRTIKDALAAEQDFFRNHPDADRCGVPLLAKRMDRVLVQHSKSYLRLLKSRLLKARAIAASGSLAETAR